MFQRAITAVRVSMELEPLLDASLALVLEGPVDLSTAR